MQRETVCSVWPSMQSNQGQMQDRDKLESVGQRACKSRTNNRHRYRHRQIFLKKSADPCPTGQTFRGCSSFPFPSSLRRTLHDPGKGIYPLPYPSPATPLPPFCSRHLWQPGVCMQCVRLERKIYVRWKMHDICSCCNEEDACLHGMAVL